ncbi:MAG TPA: ABC transporter ATP-binding protein [Alphaproteobacteria bacterium]|nr:ABC transporter ATP-binding protein [Alphaproteobacteria bacterium]
MSFIAISGVDLIYGNQREGGNERGTLALADVSLAIERGAFVSIVGPSGCGKSTLLKLVAGLVAASRGEVRVAGAVVTRPLKIVGMAFQNASLLPWRSIAENVLLPLEIVEPYRSRFKQDRAKNRARVEELLGMVGLSGFAALLPWQLSGGMQQRAQLCRALIHEPEILLLDEPFAALDTFTREELWGALQTLYRNRRCTVILVTHELREAVYLSDTVHVMSARPGKVIATKAVDIARPRALDCTFRPDFVALVQELRHHIGMGKAS